MNPDAEHRDQQGVGCERPASPSPSAETLEGLATELSDLLWSRQARVLEWLPYTWPRSSVRNPGLWRDQLLAEIENLAAELNKKVARYSSMRATPPSDEPSVEASTPADAAAVAWMHQTLEDIAATALGMELASREVLLQAGMAEAQPSDVRSAQDPGSPTAD